MLRCEVEVTRTRVAAVVVWGLVGGCVEPLDVPAYGVYQAYGLVVEAKGLLPGPAGPSLGRIVLARFVLSGPRSPPDFVDDGTPPNCLGFVLDPSKPPGGNSLEAGTVRFQGLDETQVRDFADPTNGVLVDVPGATLCFPVGDPFRGPGETGVRYRCELPRIGVLTPSAHLIQPDGRVVIGVSGGSDIASFTSRGLSTPPVLAATEDFDLTAVNPDSIVAEWLPAAAPLVLIEVIALPEDGSAGAQILCLEPMFSGRKVIPDAALALIPKPAGDTRLLIITTIAAVNFDSSTSEGWGGYLVGVGRGSVGVSCRFAGGSCVP